MKKRAILLLPLLTTIYILSNSNVNCVDTNPEIPTIPPGVMSTNMPMTPNTTQPIEYNPTNVPAGIVIPPQDRCGSGSPNKSTDCTNSNTLTQYCCYMTPLEGGPGFCNTISPPKYEPYMKTYQLYNREFKIECDIAMGTQGTPCGTVNPEKYTDCTSHSMIDNSCCYYNSGNVTYCFWLGFSGGIGQVIPSINCAALNYAKFDHLSFFTLILFLTLNFIL